MIFTQLVVLYEFPLISRAETLLITGQRDRTAFGRTWASKSVADALDNYLVLGR